VKILRTMMAMCFICVLCIGLYHKYVFEPAMDGVTNRRFWTVDMKTLSQAKLSALLQQVQNGTPVDPNEIRTFVETLRKDVAMYAGDEPVFVSNALFFGRNDLTETLAKRYQLDLDSTLSGVMDANSRRLREQANEVSDAAASN